LSKEKALRSSKPNTNRRRSVGRNFSRNEAAKQEIRTLGDKIEDSKVRPNFDVKLLDDISARTEQVRNRHKNGLEHCKYEFEMGVRSVIDNLESTEDTKALNAFLTSAEKDRQFCGRRARVQVQSRSSKERLETTTTRN
jgi:t-SNARE complex subunit (syntaxin)